MVEPHSSNFRVIRTNFLGVRILRIFTVLFCCLVVTCDHPPVVDNTTEVSPVQVQYDYLTDITYECILAYNHTDGELVRTCQANATWSGQPPVCLG